MDDSLHQAALGFARRGIAVFPCRPREKVPATPRGLHDATTDPVTVTQWWTANPEYNIGIATGAVSGFWVLDIDGDDGEASLRQLEAEHGELPETIEVVTGGGGRHLYFRLSEHDPVRNTAGRIGAGIDTRGDGGYVVAPPSLHPSGRRYEWSVDSASCFADAPDWLLEKLADHAEAKGRPLEEWHRMLTHVIPNGQRNTELAALAGKLIFCGVDLITTRDLVLNTNLARCNPPLPAHEVEMIVASVAKTHARRHAV